MFDATANPLPLLSTKLCVPPCRSQLVSRPRLINQLNDAFTQPVTLIVASAGFGKSTLVCEWMAQIDHPVAWLSLDADDNDSTRFFTYVIAALRTCRPELGETALTLLATPQPPSAKAILTMLLNDLGALVTPMALVLDDYHVITNPAIHEGVTFFLDHLPRQMHLVITSRADPPLPLARWRARNYLQEVRTDDLRFRPAEVTSFLNDVMELRLAESDVAALGKRTEGWITGLQLAALALRGTRSTQDVASPSGFVQAFTGSHRFILNYLTEEVLQRQPAQIQDFLLQTSILDRLTGDLCEAVTERSGGQENLEALAEANLFIVRLDTEGVWYRYHALFADLLRHRLQRTKAAEIPILHERASQWYAQQGQFREATKHALAASDFARAAQLVEEMADALWMRGEMNTLLGLLKALPQPIVHGRPRLSLAYAWVLTYSGPLESIEELLKTAEQVQAHMATEDRRLRGEIAAIRATVASLEGNAPRTIALCEEALTLLPPEQTFLRAALQQALGYAYRTNGLLEDAVRALSDAFVLSQGAGTLLLQIDALCNLALTQIMQGRLHAAEDTLQRAEALITRANGQWLPIALELYFGWAALLLERNELDAAEKYLRRGSELGRENEQTDLAISLHSLWARLRHASGDGVGALAEIEMAVQLAQHYNVERIIRQMRAYQARIWVAYGQFEAAARWAQNLATTVGHEVTLMREAEAITFARVYFAQGEMNAALALLNKLLADAMDRGRIANALQILALTALVQSAQGERAVALTTLEQAVCLAEPEGQIHPFLTEGEAMRSLLTEYQLSLIRRPVQPDQEKLAAFVGRLVAAFPSRDEGEDDKGELLPPNQNLVEPLSDREREVLDLIAAGHSNREISSKLYIEVGTVKRHISNIFGKLSVTNRTQAVAVARQLDLIP